MLPRAAILVLLLATSAACARSGDAPSDMSKKSAENVADAVALESYPLNRLRFAHNPIEPLELPTPLVDADLKARGVQRHFAFTATSPRVWLLVFEFADQGALFAALQDPRLLLPGEPPYYTATAFTGPWLLVTGFPGEKPVSPEMEAARTIFLESWSGAQ